MNDKINDDRIIELLFARNGDGIDMIDKAYRSYLLAVSMNILSDPLDAEECFNDTLQRAWESIPPARPASLGAYLSKIIRNISINRLRKNSAAKRTGEPVPLQELGEIASDENIAENTAESDNLRRVIEEFLDTLSERDRALFIERYFYYRSLSDISKRINLEPKQISVILFKTREKLRKHLKKEGYTL